MKNNIKTIALALFAITFFALTGCNKNENITV